MPNVNITPAMFAALEEEEEDLQMAGVATNRAECRSWYLDPVSNVFL